MKKILFSIIVPAYNEELVITEVLDSVFADALAREVIVVDDGSTDRTAELVSEYMKSHKKSRIKLISHPYNKGYGAALKTGIRAAKTPYVMFFDADGQHRPEDVEALISKVAGYDMLVGERKKDSYQEWIRKPGKWALSKVANFLTGRKIPDLNSGLRIVKRDLIASILHLFPDGFSFSTTSTIAFMNLGLSVGYVAVRVDRRKGKSSVKQLKHGANVVLLILRLIILFNPLKVFLPTSVFLFSVGVIYEILYGIFLSPQGVKLIAGAFFLMLTGTFVFFFGLLVDQVSEMRKHLNIRR